MVLNNPSSFYGELVPYWYSECIESIQILYKAGEQRITERAGKLLSSHRNSSYEHSVDWHQRRRRMVPNTT